MRNYKPKRQTGREKKHNQSDVDSALHLVKNGMSKRKAAKTIGMSESTLRSKLKAMKSPLHEISYLSSAKRGTKNSLPEEAEVSLATMIRLCSRWGLGLDSDAVRGLVQEYIKQNKEKPGELGAYLKKYCRFKVCNSHITI